MPNKIPKPVSSKVFKIFGVSLHCHVLDDGRRIISSDSLVKLLDTMAAGIPDLELEEHDLDHFIFWCRSTK
jgi:hypothetical protein